MKTVKDVIPYVLFISFWAIVSSGTFYLGSVMTAPSKLEKCADYDTLHDDITTKWLSGYRICIDTKTKEKINL